LSTDDLQETIAELTAIRDKQSERLSLANRENQKLKDALEGVKGRCGACGNTCFHHFEKCLACRHKDKWVLRV